MKQIVCLSTSNFFPYPTRKQNVMQRLTDAEILYFDPPVSLLAPLKDKAARSRLFACRRQAVKASERITVYALPPVLPFYNKYRWINRLNQKCQARYIRRCMMHHGFTQPLLWCYSPAAVDILPHLSYSGLVYDCVDRHSAYCGLIDPSLVDSEERELAQAADQVFCTAAGLYDTLSAYNPHTKLIPNGVDYDLFSRAAAPVEGKPGAAPYGPRYGFVGMLQDCVAYDYLLALADARPDAEIVLVGRVMPGVEVEALLRRPNIRLLGLKPQRELPDIMRGFDVCLNLFAPGRLSRDVSPLKFYEYLATGKPLVSTREPLQVNDYADLIYIADDIGQFINLCDQAATEDNPSLCTRRMAAAKQASWDNRVRQMEEILHEAGLFAAV